MKKLVTILALGMLATACVPHDPDVTTEPAQPYWQQSQQPQKIVVQQPQVQARPIIVQQKADPAKETWWKNNKQKHVVKVVVPTCPCKDPNDPCTQCYQK